LKKTENKAIKITEPQKNSLRTSLTILERTFDEIERLCTAKDKIGELYENINDFSEQERILLIKKIASIRKYIAYLKIKLNLPKERISTKRTISSHLAGLWEIGCELESKRLKGYGAIDNSLKEVSDPVVKRIIQLLSESSDILMRKK